MSKAQTATEYLVILGVVIVIGLITVTTLTDITGFGSGIDEKSARLQLQTLDIGISDYAVSADETQMTFTNNLVNLITVTSIEIDDVPQQICSNDGQIRLSAGQQKSLAIGYSSEEEFVEASVRINYTDTKTGASYSTSKEGAKLVGKVAASQFVDPDGTYVWNYTYNANTQYSDDFGTYYSEFFQSISVDSCGNIITNGHEGTGFYDFTIFFQKLSSDGRLLWHKNYGMIASYDSERGYGSYVDNVGNIYLTGSEGDALILKYSPAGNLLVEELYGTSYYDEGWGITTDSDGNIIGTGYVGTSMETDISLYKYSSDGSQMWNATIGAYPEDVGRSVVTDSDNSIYVTGSVNNFEPYSTTVGGGGSYDLIVLKYDSDGNYLWNFTLGKTGSDNGLGITVDSDGYIYAVGNVYNYYDSTTRGGGSYRDIVLIKLDSDGTYLWNKTFGGSGTDSANSVAIDKLNNIYVAGNVQSMNDSTTIGGGGQSDAIVIKYDSDGTYLWNKTFGGSSQDYGYGVAVSGIGEVYLGGTAYSSEIATEDNDAFIFKFS